PEWEVRTSCRCGCRRSSACRSSRVLLGLVGVGNALAGDLVAPVGPAREILQLAALAAERPPGRVDRPAPAEHAHRVRHGPYSLPAHPLKIYNRATTLTVDNWSARAPADAPWANRTTSFKARSIC